MANVTIVPIGHNEIEVSFGGDTVRFVLPRDGESGEAKDGGEGTDSGDKGSGTPTAPTVSGAGGSTPKPIRWPPHIPLRVQPVIGDPEDALFAHGSVEALHSLVTEFNQALNMRSGQGPRHLVVTLPHGRIDLHELAQKFAHLHPAARVTVLLTRDHG